MAVPAFEAEMHDQLALARRQLEAARADADPDGVGLAEARLLDLVELARRQGVDVAGAAV